MSWITVDTGLHNHPKMAALPNDSARWGWICVLVEAKEQRKPGAFASANHFRLVMDRHGRFLNAYIAAKLLDENADGSLHVHDWKQHQWAVQKAQQRETPRGHGEDKDETLDGPQADASRAVPVRVPVSVEEATEKEDRAGAEEDAVVAFHQRTGEVPGPKIRSWLDELAHEHGEQRVASMISATPLSGLKVPDYLRSVRDRLRLDDYAAERTKRTTPKPPRKTDAEVEAEYKATAAETAKLMGRAS